VGHLQTPSNAWLLEPTQVYHPISISISSAVFTSLTKWPTYRHKQTHRPRYSVCRPRLAAVAVMQSNNNNNNNNNKYVRLRGLTYIDTMPILRPHAARFHKRRISSTKFTRRGISTVMFTSRWAWPTRWLIRPISGFWGSKVYKNGRFPALDAVEPPCKIWRCYLYPRRRNP